MKHHPKYHNEWKMIFSLDVRLENNIVLMSTHQKKLVWLTDDIKQLDQNRDEPYKSVILILIVQWLILVCIAASLRRFKVMVMQDSCLDIHVFKRKGTAFSYHVCNSCL